MKLFIDRPDNELGILRLSGKFVIEDVDDFKARSAPLARAPVRHILVDCSDLTYIDSSGIGALIVLTNTARKLAIGMIFYNVNKDIMNVFRIAFLDKFFRIATKEDLAVSFPGAAL